MSAEKSRAGAARGFTFTRGIAMPRPMTPKRWLVWFWEHETWRCAAAPMPEGAAASYADVEHRYAGAIAMEAVEDF
jgi:hypothetical protein